VTSGPPREWPISWIDPSTSGAVSPMFGNAVVRYGITAAAMVETEYVADRPSRSTVDAAAQSSRRMVSSFVELSEVGDGPVSFEKLVIFTSLPLGSTRS